MMEDIAKLEALRSWIVCETGSKAFFRASSVRAYERSGNFLIARIAEGAITLESLVPFAQRLCIALRTGLRAGADDEDCYAIIAFWTNATAFASQLLRTDRVAPAETRAPIGRPLGRRVAS